MRIDIKQLTLEQTSASASDAPDDNTTIDTEVLSNCLVPLKKAHLPFQAETTCQLLLHIKVNAIGNFFQIEQLMELATSNIQGILNRKWSAVSFAVTSEKACKSTDDQQLLAILASIAKDHLEELVELPDFEDLTIMKYYGVSVLQSVVKDYKARKDSTQTQLTQVHKKLQERESHIRSLTLERDDFENRTGRITDNIQDCLGVLYQTKHCRNTTCDTGFGCFIEYSDNTREPKYLLRCKRCRCRHFQA